MMMRYWRITVRRSRAKTVGLSFAVTLVVQSGPAWANAPGTDSREISGVEASRVRLQDPSKDVTAQVHSYLEAAERAYQEVDFATVEDQARQGLALGHAAPEQVSRFYVLLGTASAALGHEDEAKSCFVAALALSPQMSLDRNLSPKLRGPYLEAKGYWEGNSQRLTLSVSVSSTGTDVTSKVSDPAHLTQQVRLYIRLKGEKRYQLKQVDSSGRATTPLPKGIARKAFEYFAQLVDGHGNRLFELGNTDSPQRFDGRDVDPRSSDASERRLSVSSDEAQHARSYWLPSVLAVSGLAAAVTGVYFNVKREHAAAQWNGSGCEQPGATRIGQCGHVNSERQNSERLAVGFYAAGGLLMLGGLSTWILGSTSAPPQQEGLHSPETHARSSRLPCQLIADTRQVFCVGTF